MSRVQMFVPFLLALSFSVYVGTSANVAFPPRGSGASPIKIKHWPQDVPCPVLRELPDNSWNLEQSVVDDEGHAYSGNTYLPSTPEAKMWDKKCEKH